MSADLCGYHGDQRAHLERSSKRSIPHHCSTTMLSTALKLDGASRGSYGLGNQVVVSLEISLFQRPELAVNQRNQKIMEALSELLPDDRRRTLQLHKTGDPEITMDEILQDHLCKDGILISAPAGSAPLLRDSPRQGRKPFLIRLKPALLSACRDIWTMWHARKIWKEARQDLDEGKITMPLIHL